MIIGAQMAYVNKEYRNGVIRLQSRVPAWHYLRNEHYLYWILIELSKQTALGPNLGLWICIALIGLMTRLSSKH